MLGYNFVIVGNISIILYHYFSFFWTQRFDSFHLEISTQVATPLRLQPKSTATTSDAVCSFSLTKTTRLEKELFHENHPPVLFGVTSPAANSSEVGVVARQHRPHRSLSAAFSRVRTTVASNSWRLTASRQTRGFHLVSLVHVVSVCVCVFSDWRAKSVYICAVATSFVDN